jgi:hypothetical protein
MDDLDLEKLKEESERASSNKALLSTVGSALQGFADVPSAYELIKGKSIGAKPNLKAGFDNAAGMIQDPWEKQKKTYEMYKAAKENATLKEDEEVDSKSANATRAAILRKHPAIAPEMLNGLNRRQLVSVYGDPSKLAEIEAQAAVTHQNQMDLEDRRQRGEMQKLGATQSFEKQKNEAELAKKNNPQERMKNMPATDKQRYDNALMVLKSLDSMAGALDGGQNTFSMVGDNDYTAGEMKAAEAFGRMQSGGAINKDEEKRFIGMLPKTTDSKEMQRKKILAQRDEMVSRLKTLGFTPEEAGYAPKQFTYGASKEELQNTAQAGGKVPVKKLFNQQLNKTRITYSDGTTEELDGRQ